MEIQYWLITLDSLIDEMQQPRKYACEFINHLASSGAPFLVVTTHLSKTHEQIAEMLQNIGFTKLMANHIFTEVDIAASYCKQLDHHKNTAGYIGQKNMKYTLLENGFILTQEKADYLFVGSDHHRGYEDYNYAFQLLESGAKLICTDTRHSEVNHEKKMIGSGAITAMLAYASNSEPIYVCYPNAMMIEEPIKYLNAKIPRSVFIGCNYNDHIVPSCQIGLKTIWLNTGKDDINVFESKYHPDYVIEDFAGLMRIFGQ